MFVYLVRFFFPSTPEIQFFFFSCGLNWHGIYLKGARGVLLYDKVLSTKELDSWLQPVYNCIFINFFSFYWVKKRWISFDFSFFFPPNILPGKNADLCALFITTNGRIIHTCRLMEEFFSLEFILWFDIDYHSEIFFMCWLAWWWIKPVCVFSQNPFPVKLPHSKSGFLEFRRYYGE